jgi:hypothetical protein
MKLKRFMLNKKIGIRTVLTVLTLLIGSFLRVYHLLRIDFSHEPFRLGGLFVAFAGQIAQDGFKLPITIPYYSEGGIPFAYPPFGFYVEAVLFKLFPGQQLVVANLLPPLVCVLALLVACQVLRWIFPGQENHFLAGLFAYAFLPNAFSSQIEAGGLAESFGSLALLIYFASIFRYRSKPNNINALWSGLALGLCILSSPGSAIGAAVLFLLLAVESFIRHKAKTAVFMQAGIILTTGALVSAPYWLTVMLNHGRGFFILPVLAQYQNGGKIPYFFALFNKLVNFNVADGSGAFFWNIVIFLGLFWLLLHRKFFIPLAFLILFSIPRENFWLVAFPAALLFAHGFGDVILSVSGPIPDMPSPAFRKYISAGIIALVMLVLVLQPFSLVNALIADQQWKLTRIQFEGVKNAAVFIPPNQKVLVLGNDALLEWSPYLLQREVINTKFGLEWQPVELEKINLLNTRLQAAKNWDDVLLAVSEMNGQSHIYILSTQKQLLTELNRDSHTPFTLELETPEVQVGILGVP